MLGSGCCISSAVFDAFVGDVGATATRQPGKGGARQRVPPSRRLAPRNSAGAWKVKTGSLLTAKGMILGDSIFAYE